MTTPDIYTASKPKEVLNTERVSTLSNVIIKTFEFSQGDPLLQYDIIEYLLFENPDYHMNLDEEPIVKQLVRSLIAKRLEVHKDSTPKLHKSIADSRIDSELTEPFRRMTRDRSGDAVFEGDERNAVYDGFIQDITTKIIDRDSHFLDGYYVVGGRPRGVEFSLDSKFSPWMSHLRTYAFDKKSTGVPELDKMFQDVGLLVKRKIESGEWIDGISARELFQYRDSTKESQVDELFKIAKVWEEKHGESFFKPLGIMTELTFPR